MNLNLRGTDRVALVDDVLADTLRAHPWRLRPQGTGQVYIGYSKAGRMVMLHRFLVDAKAGEVVDHINGDTFDNRIANLRLCTHAENMRNRRTHRNNACGLKGVVSCRAKWVAQIQHAKKRIRVGGFDTKEDAHEFYRLAADLLHGQFARHS